MKKNWMKKVVTGSLTAALAVGIMLPASASAADSTYKATTVTTYKVVSADSLNAYIQQWLKQNGYKATEGQVVEQPAAQPVTKPEQPSTPAKPVQEEKPATTTPAKDPSSTGNNGTQSSQSDFAAQVVKLVNAERSKAGLGSLASDALLDKVAMAKVKDMSNNNYFDHQSPTYGSPFDMMKQFGVTYSYAGENIAKGQKTPQEVVTAWMNSAGHRANILSKNFTHIGVGFYNGYWAQEFIGK
ncbi:CAP domain-containing protein [Paenibacillus sp. TSA_86.1]|uniref:CAP domain-containing protein n=1 Tax=Paenibacillus sp. TSA_86.1 TaxID=3415649 RepID=UPI0040456971